MMGVRVPETLSGQVLLLSPAADDMSEGAGLMYVRTSGVP